MKKIYVLLFALIAGAFAMQMNAAPGKAPSRSSIYNSDQGFAQLGSTSIYYDISQRSAAGPGQQYGVSILGRVKNNSWTSLFYPYRYYSSTYEQNGPGAGFIAAFQVNGGTAKYLDAKYGSDQDGVHMTANIVPQGDVAARVIYTLHNTTDEAVTVNAGIWGDIMIGDNDEAPLSRMINNSNGETYGIKMKHENTEDDNTVFLCILFGDHVTGVTAADDYWFGFFSSNWHANEICGEYSSYIYPTNTDWGQNYAQYYLKENGTYDSGLGFCWKDREIPAGESIELSYVISVGEIDFMEPIDPDPEPGQDIRTLYMEAFDCAGWNDYEADHPIHIWGYYEHPYGQEGYFEYQIDNETDFHRLETVNSGEDFDQNFNVQYDADKTDYHVIRVRFNDGLGNVSAVLDSLAWTDVRSFTVTGIEDRVYNGEPQVFNVNITREALTYVGETNPGNYNFTIVGAFAENTMGVKEVPYTINKAQAAIIVNVPDDVEYDGNPHAASYVLNPGDGTVTLTYINMGTGETLTTAPTEIGIYAVVVAVSDGQYYYGIPETVYGEFAIYSGESTAVSEINAATQDKGAWFTIDGRRVAAPTQPGIYIHNGKKYIVK